MTILTNILVRPKSGGWWGGGGGGSLPNPGHPKYAANDSTLLIFSWFLCFRVGGGGGRGSILSISHIS